MPYWATICRVVLLPLVASMVIVLPRAAAVYAANYPVTDTTDAAQAPGFPGQCVSTQPGGTCTLRAALQAAQQIAGPHQINVQTAGVYALSGPFRKFV